MSDIKPRKMVSRSVAIALGVVCIILVASLGAVLYLAYAPASAIQTTFNNYKETHTNSDSDYNSLYWNYSSYASTHRHNTSEYDSLNTQNADLVNVNSNLQNQVDNMHIWGTQNSTILANNEIIPLYPYTFSFSFQNSFSNGYVSVRISPTLSTYSNNISINATFIYTSNNGTDYTYQTLMGIDGIAIFPVLPTSQITVHIGTSNIVTYYNANVTITYYY